MMKHITILNTTSANIYRRANEYDGFDEEFGENRYWCSYDFSPTGKIEDIEEYDMDMESFSTPKEADIASNNYLLVNENMNIEDTIAQYIKFNGKEKELFFVPKNNEFPTKENIVVVGMKNNDDILLKFYKNIEDLNIEDFEDLNGKLFNTLTYKSNDKAFDKDFKIS